MLSFFELTINRPIDHQSTTNDRLKPVLTTGLVNTHIDRSIANPDFKPYVHVSVSAASVFSSALAITDQTPDLFF